MSPTAYSRTPIKPDTTGERTTGRIAKINSFQIEDAFPETTLNASNTKPPNRAVPTIKSCWLINGIDSKSKLAAKYAKITSIGKPITAVVY